MDVFDEIEDGDTEQEVKESRQVQLDELPVGRCPVCGEKLLESDKYKGFDDYLECRNCEKVVKKSEL